MKFCFIVLFHRDESNTRLFLVMKHLNCVEQYLVIQRIISGIRFLFFFLADDKKDVIYFKMY